VKNLKKIMVSLNLGDITRNKEIAQTRIWEVCGQLEEMIINSKPKK
jgi:hypothetical protein